MNTRNRIILIIILLVDACLFAYGLYMKNQSVDFAQEVVMYKNIKMRVEERQYTLITEIGTVQDSLKKCCNR